MPKTMYDYEKVLFLHRKGYSEQEIAKAIGRKKILVKRILAIEGRKTLSVKKGLKCPIDPIEIGWMRNQLRIGDRIWVEIPETEKTEKCTIVEKYPWVCRVEDKRGKRHTVEYIEMLVRERKGAMR